MFMYSCLITATSNDSLYPHLHLEPPPQAMFSTDLMEARQERVAINGVEPQMIGMLVSYAYTSEVVISKANVQVRYSLPANIHVRCLRERSALRSTTFHAHLCERFAAINISCANGDINGGDEDVMVPPYCSFVESILSFSFIA